MDPESFDAVEAASEPEWAEVARGAASRLRGTEDEDSGDGVVCELLVFSLEEAAYAIEVERVREIVRMKELTRIPRSPAWLLGVVALRGEVVEVLDLRRRLGLGASVPGRSHRIIVLHGEADHVTGLLVDSVTEVYRVGEDRMIPAQGPEASSISRLCPRGEDFISILDVDRAVGVGHG